MGRYEEFTAHIGDMDWYHAGKAHALGEVLRRGMDTPVQPEPGAAPSSAAYGTGLNLASNPKHVDRFRKAADSSWPGQEAGVLKAKLKARNPLVFAESTKGVSTPGYHETLLKGIENKRAQIDEKVKSGEIHPEHAERLHAKLDNMALGVKSNFSPYLGQTAPLAGFDAYVTDEHQLNRNASPANTHAGLQAVAFRPRAVRPVGLHTSKQFSQLFMGY